MSRIAEISALAALVFLCTACAAAPAPAMQPSIGELEQWTDSVAAAVMAEDRIPGAAVVWVLDGERVLSKGYGLADVESLRPVTADGTVFRIGSVTKLVTALALAQLVDRRVVGLDDPVGTHLPNLPTTSPSGTPILVRHLLSHSGGFDQVGARRQVDDPAERPAIREFLERELVPLREPGQVGVYDTYGITLAGHLIERLSGLPYEDYVRRNVFEPLGMQSSWVEVPAPERGRLAVGYGLEAGELKPQPYEWYVTLPASSVDATAADMGRLMAALLGEGGGLLSPAMTERVRSERLLSHGEMGAFSWGFWEEDHRGYRALHHGGVMRGYSSELYMVPGERVGFYVAYNRDFETGPPATLREALTNLLYERVLPPSDNPPAAPEEPLAAAPSERVAGVYGGTVGCFTCAEGEGWPVSSVAVSAEAPGVITLYGGSARFFATDTLTYRSGVSGRELRFLTDERGRIRYMVQGTNSFARLDEVLLDDVLGPGWRTRPPEPLVATVHRATGDWPAAAGAYGSLSRRTPENGRFAFYEGFSLLHTGRWSAAREAFRRALDVGQWSAWSQYYIAAAHAGAGETDQAWEALDRAIEMGFGDPDLLRAERWWDGLRDTAQYAGALERLGG